MPYLDWKNLTPQQLRQDIGPSTPEGSGDKMKMTLSMESAELATLAGFLRDTLDPATSGELRLELPRGWIVFWKKREGDSRLLMAHPQTDEWVATVALASQPAAQLVEGVEQLAAPGATQHAVSVGELAAPDGWGSVNNLELVIARL